MLAQQMTYRIKSFYASIVKKTDLCTQSHSNCLSFCLQKWGKKVINSIFAYSKQEACTCLWKIRILKKLGIVIFKLVYFFKLCRYCTYILTAKTQVC